jgi:nucleoside triphosphate diphosphatase
MTRHGIPELLELMRRLRDPQTGCPWDIGQDHVSLVPHTLEEVYELADAVARSDFAQMRDELGDYLFQAVFYAQIAAEQQRFDFDDVTHAIVEKLLRRHPHVFPDGTLASRREPGQTPETAAIKSTWERLKQDDRAQRAMSSVLDDVPMALPALQRAEKLQRRASGMGFDWSEWRGVLLKLDEEREELLAAAATGDLDACEDELGDLLFCCVNLARHLGVNAELALRRANLKFETRFRAIEEQLRARGLSMQDCDLQLLDSLWDEAKRTRVEP